jgi:hypothetical protein
MIVYKYKEIIEDFLNGKISADEFQTHYLKNFKEWNDKMDWDLSKILNRVFEAADCYSHDCFPGQETVFEISEQQLRREVAEALVELNKFLDSRSS